MSQHDPPQAEHPAKPDSFFMHTPRKGNYALTDICGGAGELGR